MSRWTPDPDPRQPPPHQPAVERSHAQQSAEDSRIRQRARERSKQYGKRGRNHPQVDPRNGHRRELGRTRHKGLDMTERTPCLPSGSGPLPLRFAPRPGRGPLLGQPLRRRQRARKTGPLRSHAATPGPRIQRRRLHRLHADQTREPPWPNASPSNAALTPSNGPGPAW